MIKSAIPSTSLASALSLLRLFSAKKPSWTIDELVAATGLSRSTAYRYVRDMVASGMLFVVSGKFYELGPAIIELDNLIQQCDPLLRVLPSIVQKIRSKNQHGVVVHRLYNMRVVCVFTDRPDQSFESTYRRGDPVPLFSEATSRVMIAHLPLRKLHELYLASAEEVHRQGLGTDWQSFRASLAAIRKQGWAMTRNLEKDQSRLSAPIFNAGGQAIAGLSQSLPSSEPDPEYVQQLARLICQWADEIGQHLAAG